MVPTPYFALTGRDGTFTIKDVPPGTYTLKTWSADGKPTTQTITVAAGDKCRNSREEVGVEAWGKQIYVPFSISPSNICTAKENSMPAAGERCRVVGTGRVAARSDQPGPRCFDNGGGRRELDPSSEQIVRRNQHGQDLGFRASSHRRGRRSRSLATETIARLCQSRIILLRGSDLYRLNCRGCHGEFGQGAPPEINSITGPVQATSVAATMDRMKKSGREISRSDVTAMAKESKIILLQRLHSGGQRMPPPTLSEPEIRSLVAYLEQLSEVPGAEKNQIRYKGIALPRWRAHREVHLPRLPQRDRAEPRSSGNNGRDAIPPLSYPDDASWPSGLRAQGYQRRAHHHGHAGNAVPRQDACLFCTSAKTKPPMPTCTSHSTRRKNKRWRIRSLARPIRGERPASETFEKK